MPDSYGCNYYPCPNISLKETHHECLYLVHWVTSIWVSYYWFSWGFMFHITCKSNVYPRSIRRGTALSSIFVSIRPGLRCFPMGGTLPPMPLMRSIETMRLIVIYDTRRQLVPKELSVLSNRNYSCVEDTFGAKHFVQRRASEGNLRWYF